MDADVVDTWERLVGYHRATLQQMDASLRTAFGHSLDDYDVLHQLAVDDRPTRMGDLSDRLLVANSSCTRIVGRLADAGYLVRHRGTTDRREIRVELTPAGRRLHRRMAALHGRDIRRLFGERLSPTGRRAIAAALDDLRPEGGS